MSPKARNLNGGGPHERAVLLLDDVLGIDHDVKIGALQGLVDGGLAFAAAGSTLKIVPGYSANSRSPERNNPKMTLVEETAWSVVVVSTTTVALTGSMAQCCTLGELGAANGGGRTTRGQSHGHAEDQKNAIHALKE